MVDLSSHQVLLLELIKSVSSFCLWFFMSFASLSLLLLSWTSLRYSVSINFSLREYGSPKWKQRTKDKLVFWEVYFITDYTKTWPGRQKKEEIVSRYLIPRPDQSLPPFVSNIVIYILSKWKEWGWTGSDKFKWEDFNAIISLFLVLDFFSLNRRQMSGRTQKYN